MTHHKNTPECLECESKNVIESQHIDDVYHCQDCGAYFEDDDLGLDLLRQRRHRELTKEIFAQ